MTKPPSAPRFERRPEQRIAKLLARAGIASRRETERMIADGRVALDGKVLDTPATILPSLRGVTVDGRPVQEPAPARLFRYHKPPGLLTAERDPAGRPTIYDRLPRDLPRVVPVGRLDLNTEGLLLLTTDGELKRELELPSTGVTRTYRARAFGEVSQEQLEELIHGVTIEGIRYGSIDANLERRTGRNQWIELTITEGKNREVRRILEHLGLQVSRLIRTAYGPIPLADLPPGAVDEIRHHDLVEFRRNLRGPRLLPPPAADGGDARPKPRRTAPPARGATAKPPRPARPPLPARNGPPRPPSSRVGEGRAEGRAASAAQKTERASRPAPPPSKRAAKPSKAEREALHHRPPTGAEAVETTGKPTRPKRGAGWAKAKPRPSTRPTRRGASPKRTPTKGRPGGSKR